MGQADRMPLPPPVLTAGTLLDIGQPVLAAGAAAVLRPFAEADAPSVLRAYSDPAIRHWNVREMASEAEAAAWIREWAPRWQNETDACWAVVGRDDEVMGRLAVRDIDLVGGQGQCTYWMLPGARGRGLATAAVQAVCRWAFGDIGFHRLSLIHSVANPASCRVAMKAGFALEGTFRRYQLLDDGWHDVHTHARLQTDPDG
jgi:[ribosomal protein S5]-alanine N-acetyltransferase